jgi:hypothetical protein
MLKLAFRQLLPHGVDLQSHISGSAYRFSTCRRAAALNESKQSENETQDES